MSNESKSRRILSKYVGICERMENEMDGKDGILVMEIINRRLLEITCLKDEMEE